MTDLIFRAARFACMAHKGQFRKHSQGAYINHPKRVAGDLCLEQYATPEMVAAAWLHDVVEDTSVTHDNILQSFGPEVATYVRELTFFKNPDLPRSENKRIQCEFIAQASVEAKIIKCYDRWDNLHDLPNDDFRKLYATETLLLLEAMRISHFLPVAERLEIAAISMAKEGGTI